jgi:signal peptidase I
VHSKPNKWIAVLISIFLPPAAMLYVAKPVLALVASILLLAIVGVGFIQPQFTIYTLYINAVIVFGFTFLAFFFAKRYDASALRPLYSRWYGVLGLAAIFALGVFAFRAFLYEPFRIPSGNMEPNFPVGSNIIVSKWGYGHYTAYGVNISRAPISAALSRGDVITFEYPENREKIFIKRLIGLPGDMVVYKAKALAINGRIIPHELLNDPLPPRLLGSGALQQHRELLDGEQYIALTDNRYPTLTKSAVRNFPNRDKCVYDNDGFVCNVPAGHYFTMGDNRDNSDDSRYWGFVPADAILGKVTALPKL